MGWLPSPSPQESPASHSEASWGHVQRQSVGFCRANEWSSERRHWVLPASGSPVIPFANRVSA